MISITESVVIDRPHESVFAYACDYQNDSAWRAGVIEMRLDPAGPSRLGSRTRETLRFFLQTIVTEGEVTEFGPNRRIAFRSTSGPMAVSSYREVAARDGGTTFTFHIAGTPSGLFALFAPVVERMFRQRLKGDLQRLKAAIEQR